MNNLNLTPAPLTTDTKTFSVTELTAGIKNLLESGFGAVSVRGEISNFRPASSGHIYFVLKDTGATIAAALFRGNAIRQKNLQLKDGVEVICHGRLSVYPPRGSYQIIVDSIEPVGAGSLQAAFEALKQKLFKEGLFDEKRKRPLPFLPERIVVITSPTGAAIRDVLSVFARRFHGVNVLIVPALVQGEGAEAELVRAMRVVNEHKLGDVILLTRGGGSLEDLWCFNSEALAREIFKSKIPVVSAVGHEIDFTIADFVADLRAPTPSAAAEILVKEKKVLDEAVTTLARRLLQVTRRNFENAKLKYQAVIAKLKNPKDRINDLRLRFDDWTERLFQAFRRNLEQKRNQVERLEAGLKALSPLQVLERGYSLVYTTNGVLVREATQTKKNMEVEIRFAKGKAAAQILKLLETEK